TDRSVLGLVLSESILVMSIGGAVGLALGWAVVQGLAKAFATYLPGLFLSPEAVLTGLALMVGAGILAGIFPAWTAMRLSIVAALARG
ncbi:MAG TPA: FtsX-like permease family protein, partial [Woeseiaceae bacterium]|nr:FtsX-like permease family protein [Woeseiaceae bacterium]